MISARWQSIRRELDQLFVASSIGALAGFWLFLSAFTVHQAHPVCAMNNLVCGVLAMPLSFGAYVRAAASWLAAALGGWILFSPWILGFADERGAMGTNVVSGAATFVAALWSGVARMKATQAKDAQERVLNRRRAL